MSLCDVLVAVGLTFGGLCAQPSADRVPALPPDEKDAWLFKPAKPEPVMPPMPPVVIERIVTTPAPPPPPPPAPPPAPVFREDPPPNPYRLALAATLASRAYGGNMLALDSAGSSMLTTGAAGAGLLSASLAPPGSSDLPMPAPGIQEKYQYEARTSGLPVDSSRILTTDRYISGIVETGFNSQIDSKSGGQVIIQTSRDVFGYHGRNLLVPKGSRMVCDYTSPKKQGDSRIAFNCSRVLMAGYRSEILQLATPVGDVQGRGGVSGDVDNRFWERYGTAFILAGISAAVRLGTAAGTQTTTTTTSTTTTGSTTAAIADKGAQELSQKLGEIAATDLERNINLAPIITIAQGTRVQLRPAQDLYIRRIDDGPPPPISDTASSNRNSSTR